MLHKKQKKKKHFLDRITGLTGSFKRLIFYILFIQYILSKGFNVSYVYPSFCCFRQERKKVYHDFPLNQDCLTFDLC